MRMRTPRVGVSTVQVLVAGASTRYAVGVRAVARARRSGDPVSVKNVRSVATVYHACKVGSDRSRQRAATCEGSAARSADDSCAVPAAGTPGAQSTSPAVSDATITWFRTAPALPRRAVASVQDSTASPAAGCLENQRSVALVTATRDRSDRDVLPRQGRAARVNSDLAATHVPGACSAEVHGGVATMAGPGTDVVLHSPPRAARGFV